MIEMFTSPEVLLAFLTLTALEIVLGIDNLIFITILSSRLPLEEQKRARSIGLFMAMASRVLLLFCISLIMKLTSPIITILENDISGRDLILVIGGLFLLVKSTSNDGL